MSGSSNDNTKLVAEYVRWAVEHGRLLSDPRVKGVTEINHAFRRLHEAYEAMIPDERGVIEDLVKLYEHENLHVRYWSAAHMARFDRSRALATLRTVAELAPAGSTKGLAVGALMLFENDDSASGSS